jgi:protein-tyrosine-phosphatase
VELLSEAEGPFAVRSAGTRAIDGIPANKVTRAVARELGLDLERHVSHEIGGWICSSDFVVCMTRSHVRAVGGLFPELFPRTFTLREVVRRASSVGPQGTRDLGEWINLLHGGRTASSMWEPRPEEDVIDPINLSAAEHRSVLVDIQGLLAALVPFLARRSDAFEVRDFE